MTVAEHSYEQKTKRYETESSFLMVSFWVNNRSFNIFESFTSGHALKGPLSKEDVLSLIITFRNQNISELEYMLSKN